MNRKVVAVALAAILLFSIGLPIGVLGVQEGAKIVATHNFLQKFFNYCAKGEPFLFAGKPYVCQVQQIEMEETPNKSVS